MKLDDLITEATARRTRAVRKGKVVRRRKCPPGYKLVGGTRCVKIKSAERRNRRKGAVRANRKGNAARRRTQARSNRVRRSRKL